MGKTSNAEIGCLKRSFNGWWPSGELTFCHGKSPCLMGKSTISMAIFNSYFDITRGYRINLLDNAARCGKYCSMNVSLVFNIFNCVISHRKEPCFKSMKGLTSATCNVHSLDLFAKVLLILEPLSNSLSTWSTCGYHINIILMSYQYHIIAWWMYMNVHFSPAFFFCQAFIGSPALQHVLRACAEAGNCTWPCHEEFLI